MDGAKFEHGVVLSVSLFDTSIKKQQVKKGFTNLYVKNFPHQDFTEEDLKVNR